MGSLLFNAPGFGVRSHFEAVPGVCTYFWLPLREQKSLLAAPQDPPTPPSSHRGVLRPRLLSTDPLLTIDLSICSK